MSRLLYWTIVIGSEPTAFRAREAADLQPTLVQLRRQHPAAELRWFQKGRLWASPEEARAALARERDAARGRPRTWRPGGTHEDPRQKYKDAKKARWSRFKEKVRERADARRDADETRGPAAAPKRPVTRRGVRGPAAARWNTGRAPRKPRKG